MQQLKEFLAAICQAIREGKSDGKRLCALIIEGVKNGIIYPVQRDSDGAIVLDDETKSPIKAPLEFGEQLVPCVMDIYLQVEGNLGGEGEEFGELRRIVLSACKYAAEAQGIKWAPARTSEGFRITMDMDNKAIAASLRKNLRDDRFVAVLRESLSLLTAEVREAILADETATA